MSSDLFEIIPAFQRKYLNSNYYEVRPQKCLCMLSAMTVPSQKLITDPYVFSTLYHSHGHESTMIKYHFPLFDEQNLMKNVTLLVPNGHRISQFRV
jgi:hypothetical protein